MHCAAEECSAPAACWLLFWQTWATKTPTFALATNCTPCSLETPQPSTAPPAHHHPHPPPLAAAAAATAEDAAHALVEAAQKEWGVKYRGRNADDCTVCVAFL